MPHLLQVYAYNCNTFCKKSMEKSKKLASLYLKRNAHDGHCYKKNFILFFIMLSEHARQFDFDLFEKQNLALNGFLEVINFHFFTSWITKVLHFELESGSSWRILRSLFDSTFLFVFINEWWNKGISTALFRNNYIMSLPFFKNSEKKIMRLIPGSSRMTIFPRL